MLKIKKVLHYVDFKNFNIMLFKKRDDHTCYVFRKNDKKNGRPICDHLFVL